MSRGTPKYAWRFRAPPGYTYREKILDSFVPERAWRWIMHASVQHIHGPEEIAYSRDELVVVCLVRDGRSYVRSFVEHYRSLGVKHMVFLDNGSTDGTVEALSSYEGVTVLSSTLPYKKYKYLFKQYLHSRFGKNRWTLYVDIDEMFDYPYSEVVDLSSFLGYLNKKSYTAVVAQMLDMFPERTSTAEVEQEDSNLKELHRFYDLSGIWKRKAKENPRFENNMIDSDGVETLSGGVRGVLFGIKPNLTKFPLVFSDGKVQPSSGSSHRINGARVADLTCVLLHYTFLEDFHEKAQRAVEEGNYYADSWEYRRYLEVLQQDPGLRFKRETSRELRDVNELVGRGFLFASEDYAACADREDERKGSFMEDEPRGMAVSLIESRRWERARGRESWELSRRLYEQGREIRRLERQLRRQKKARSPGARGDRQLKQEVLSLRRQLAGIQGSRTWRLLDALNRAKVRILKIGGKSS